MSKKRQKFPKEKEVKEFLSYPVKIVSVSGKVWEGYLNGLNANLQDDKWNAQSCINIIDFKGKL